MNRKGFKSKFFILLRSVLVLSIVINLALVIYIVFKDSHVTQNEVVTEFAKRLEFLFWGIVTLILTFGSGYIEKKNNIDIPDILEIIIAIFIYAGLFLSVRYNLYYRFFWWDDLLHTLSGVIIGFIGSIVIYRINHNYSMNLNPLLVAVFSFTFAVTMGVMWEILEFSSDVLLGTANQKWNLPDTEILMGKAYQGSGLRDTMSDLIVDSIGALITSVITYCMYRFQKQKALMDIEKILETNNHSGL